LVVVILTKRRLYGVGGGRLTYVFSALVGLEADILFRIFLFVPLGTWSWIYQFPLEFVKMVWVVSAAVTPIQVAIALLITSLAGGVLLKATGVSRQP
jgi:hypothetical protein